MGEIKETALTAQVTEESVKPSRGCFVRVIKPDGEVVDVSAAHET